jgi:hypothetical protein
VVPEIKPSHRWFPELAYCHHLRKSLRSTVAMNDKYDDPHEVRASDLAVKLGMPVAANVA